MARTAGTTANAPLAGSGGLLTGQIADEIFKGFKGKLLTGTLMRDTPSTTLDELGDPVSVTTQSWKCEGFVDNYSAYTKAVAGIPSTDSNVSIFARSLPANVRPQKDDRVIMTNGVTASHWELRNAQVDPAGALWQCQASTPEPDA
jgi:hypothetical protein